MSPRSETAAAVQPLAPPPTLALGLACAAIVVAGFARGPTLVSIAALFVVASALSALIAGAHVRESAGWFAHVAGPASAVISTVAAVLGALDGDDARLPLIGAAFVAALTNLRWWVDAMAEAPVHRADSKLRALVPSKVRCANATEPSRVTSADRVRVGEEVVVDAGDVVGVDGVVARGEALVLLHPAARSPARRVPGDPLLAGARVVDGRLRVRSTRVAAQRALLAPRLFGDGSASDAAPITRLASRVLGSAAPFFVVVAAAAFFAASPDGRLATRLAAVGGVLLAMPLLSVRRASSDPYVAAAFAAIERGISFASASAMDRAGRVTSAVIPGHGVVTEGRCELVEVHQLDAAEGISDRALSLAAAAELASRHPLGRALVERIGSRALPVVRRVGSVPGRGVRASGPEGERILVGSRQLLLEEGISVAQVEADVRRAEMRGLRAVFVAVDDKLRAWAAFRDEIRAGARAAVQRLIDLDVTPVVVSGEHRTTVEAIAREVDVEIVKAELTPEERVAEVRRLREVGGRIAVIARASEDDEMLAVADVPIRLGAAGSPEGDRGVATTSDDLRDGAAALFIARAASRDARTATVVALAAGAALVTVSALGLAAPGIVALLALGIDLYALPTPLRVLRRIELRLPVRG